MERRSCFARPDWIERVEAVGLDYHTIDGELYWDESACYEFTAREIDVLETATNTLHEMCIAAATAIVEQDRFDELGIPAEYGDWVRASWEDDDMAVFGRFDLAYDGQRPPKLLEYNADTPTSLLEAGVVQWHWLQDCEPRADQFNSIHERLIEAWKSMEPGPEEWLHFASVAGHTEDLGNCRYLQDTAQQAGWKTQYLAVEAIGYDRKRNCFVDEQLRPIEQLVKLYPWEWMLGDTFGPQLRTSETQWIEPPWKMLLSNKALLVVLWDMFPNSPYLLPAAYTPTGDSYVRKPRLSREGSNVSIVQNGRVIEATEGPYEDELWVYQEYCPLPDFGGNFPVVGSWVIGGEACGMGLREDRNRITHNMSRFVPHFFRA